MYPREREGTKAAKIKIRFRTAAGISAGISLKRERERENTRLSGSTRLCLYMLRPVAVAVVVQRADLAAGVSEMF